MVAKKGIISQEKNKAIWSLSDTWVSFIIGFLDWSASGPVRAVTLWDQSQVGAGWALHLN